MEPGALNNPEIPVWNFTLSSVRSSQPYLNVKETAPLLSMQIKQVVGACRQLYKLCCFLVRNIDLPYIRNPIAKYRSQHRCQQQKKVPTYGQASGLPDPMVDGPLRWKDAQEALRVRQ